MRQYLQKQKQYVEVGRVTALVTMVKTRSESTNKNSDISDGHARHPFMSKSVAPSLGGRGTLGHDP